MLLRAISLTLLLASSSALAEDMKAPLNAKDLKWGPAPNVFPKGAQMAIVSGDPFKDGPYVVRLKAPKGYRVPPHNHQRLRTSRSWPAIFTSEWVTSSTKRREWS